MILNTAYAWGSVAKALHWLMALLIFAMFVLGWLAVSAPMSPGKIQLFMWHKSIGLTLLGLVLVRLGWRLVNPTPALSNHTSKIEHTLARSSHAVLYALMILMPVSGYVINSTANFPLRYFGGVRVPNLLPQDKAWQETAEMVHWITFMVFVLMIAVHIAAALRHHFSKRNDVLTRMLPHWFSRD